MTKRKMSTKLKIILAVVLIVAVLVIGGGTVLAGGFFADSPEACGKCHLMQPWVESYLQSDFLDNVHAAPIQVAKCENCHRQSLFQKANEVFSYARGQRTVSGKNVNTQAACSTCHQPARIVEAVQSRPEFISNPELSYHLNAENAKACRDPRAELVRCQDCHKSHQAGVNYCATCHMSPFGVPVAR